MDIVTFVRIVAVAATVIPVAAAIGIEVRIARRRDEFDRHCETAMEVGNP